MINEGEPGRLGAVGLRGAFPRRSLLSRVFLTNAAVLAAAVSILALSPVTVSHRISLAEVTVLVAGLTAILLVNLVLFRRAFTPLVRLRQAMKSVDLLRPGGRLPTYGSDAEVTSLTAAFNEMLGRLERERRLSAHRALRAQEGERRRIAQELHDEVGQTLTAVVLQLERLRRRAPEELRAEVEETREGVRDSLEEVREIAHRLRPEALDELGLRNALAALADRISEHGELRVACRLDSRLPELDPEGELVIYRVAQEALTNVLRHAQADEARLILEVDAERLALRVVDDGRGLSGSETGAGIQGMRERALLVGASLRVSDSEAGGVEVKLEVPLLS